MCVYICVYGTLCVPSDIHVLMVYMYVYVSSFLSLPTCYPNSVCICVHVCVCVWHALRFCRFWTSLYYQYFKELFAPICGETWHTLHQQPVTVSTSMHAPTLMEYLISYNTFIGPDYFQCMQPSYCVLNLSVGVSCMD